jgi:hypothetical protein
MEYELGLVWISISNPPSFNKKLYLEFQHASKSKVVNYESIYTHEKFGKFWSNIRWDFVFYKLDAVWLNGKGLFHGLARCCHWTGSPTVTDAWVLLLAHLSPPPIIGHRAATEGPILLPFSPTPRNVIVAPRRQLRPPFPDCSCVEHHRDLAELLPQVSPFEPASSSLPDVSRDHWPPVSASCHGRLSSSSWLLLLSTFLPQVHGRGLGKAIDFKSSSSYPDFKSS